MAYHPAGYLEGDGDDYAGEGGFYFGDEEELGSYHHKFQVDVTVTSSTSENNREQEVQRKMKVFSPPSKTCKYPRKVCCSSESSDCPANVCKCPVSSRDSEGTSTSPTTTSTDTQDSIDSTKDGNVTSGNLNVTEVTGTVLEREETCKSLKRTFVAEPPRKIRDQRSLKSLEDLTDIKVAIAKGNEEAVLEKLNNGMLVHGG